MPAVILSSTDVTDIIDTLTRGLNDSRNAPLPPVAAVITDSMSCEIVAGKTVLARVEVRSTRTVVPLPSSNEAVPTPHVNQITPARGDSALASFSLPDSRPPASRAADLIDSTRRALGVFDFARACEDGGRLEEILEAGGHEQIPSAILSEGYQLLCDVEVALIQHLGKPPEVHLARAQDFLLTPA